MIGPHFLLLSRHTAAASLLHLPLLLLLSLLLPFMWWS
jgi:hypothetical protein